MLQAPVAWDIITKMKRTKAMVDNLRSRLPNKDIEIENAISIGLRLQGRGGGGGGGGDILIKSPMTAVINMASCELVEDFIGEKWPFMVGMHINSSLRTR